MTFRPVDTFYIVNFAGGFVRMSKAREYYDGLTSQGYGETQALEFTQKYYPEFLLAPVLPFVPSPPTEFQTLENPYAPPVVTSNIGQMEPEGFNPYAPIHVGTQPSAGSGTGLASLSMPNLSGMSLEKLKHTFSDRKVIAITGGIIAILLLSILAFMIPSSTGPIEGTWVKSDGAKVTFNADNTYSDGLDFSSTWNLNGDDLTMISSGELLGEYISITQAATVSFSDDEKAIWIKINSIETNGEVNSDLSSECSLLLKSSVASNAAQYVEEAPSYEDETPKMCVAEEE